MDKINDGGPAFPLSRESSISKNYEGMTLRDYFAAKALPAVIASMVHLDQGKLMRLYDMEMPQIYAAHSYEIADAMLKARG